MDGAEVRRQRIDLINKKVLAALNANVTQGYISLSKLEIKIEVETGLTNENILGILRLLDKAGCYFELDEEKDQIRRISL